jgi:hypothetical protein
MAERKDEENQTTVRDDLAAGFDLMWRAARKAARRVDTEQLQRLRQRAVEKVESLDLKRIEAVAEDAGKELLGAVQRVAGRVESILGGQRSDDDAAPPKPGPKVRVDD